MNINGAVLIGADERQREPKFHGHSAASGEPFGPAVSEASSEDVQDACRLAALAAEPFAALSPDARAAFIDAVAEAIFAIGDVLIETAVAESGLPQVRIAGERMRTVNQLRLFANEVRLGRWIDIAIDPALPDRAPPRADLRRMNIALGPVAVFGASNFPLAFSVAGGDTASAFAAGCPVIVKGHPAHPGTGELVARAVREAVRSCGLHEGVFSFLPGRTHELGTALVAAPQIKAVGFTGSRAGGLALAEIAAQRPEPIPVFAEMSSINPVVVMPHALAKRSSDLGREFVGSLTLGAGQFCTNPGIVFAVDGPDLDAFMTTAAQTLSGLDGAPMLTAAIREAFMAGVSSMDTHEATVKVAAGKAPGTANHCHSALFEVGAEAFIASPELGDEIFGASSLVVRCRDLDELAQALASLEGQLTASIHLDPADEAQAAAIITLLRAKAGRILANGWPTGVEVTHAMVHGGPFPATTDGRSTSVGTLAMMRFVRPICYQDIPDSLLPLALQSANPSSLPRRMDGVWEDAA